MTRPVAGRTCGFTLLEMLAALVVFGLLIAALTRGARVALTSWHWQATRIESQNGLGEVDRIVRGLAATIDPGTRLVGPPNFMGNARSAGFTADLPSGVSGFLTTQADVLMEVSPSHRLVLRWAPHYRTLTGAPPLPHESILAENVDHIELSYLVAGSAHAIWTDRWQSEALPELLRMRIVFRPGDTRHWPDIVAIVGGI
jgi:general secretion pathway protein J